MGRGAEYFTAHPRLGEQKHRVNPLSGEDLLFASFRRRARLTPYNSSDSLRQEFHFLQTEGNGRTRRTQEDDREQERENKNFIVGLIQNRAEKRKNKLLRNPEKHTAEIAADIENSLRRSMGEERGFIRTKYAVQIPILFFPTTHLPFPVPYLNLPFKIPFIEKLAQVPVVDKIPLIANLAKLTTTPIISPGLTTALIYNLPNAYQAFREGYRKKALFYSALTAISLVLPIPGITNSFFYELALNPIERATRKKILKTILDTLSAEDAHQDSTMYKIYATIIDSFQKRVPGGLEGMQEKFTEHEARIIPQIANLESKMEKQKPWYVPKHLHELYLKIQRFRVNQLEDERDSIETFRKIFARTSI